MEARLDFFSNIVPVARKLHGNLALCRLLVLFVALLPMAIPATAATKGCPLDMRREDLQYLCNNLPLPPPGVAFTSSQKPPTCCQLSMNFWLAKYINASSGSAFYLPPAAAKNCTDTFNNEWLPQLGLPDGQCVPLNATLLLDNPKDACQHFDRPSNLTERVSRETLTSVQTVCGSNLTDPGQCSACGTGILGFVTEMANGFPLPGCVTSVTVLMGSRRPTPAGWLSISTCVGTAVYAGSYPPGASGPPSFGGAPAPAPENATMAPAAEDGKSDPSQVPTVIGIVLGASILAVFVAIACYILLRKKPVKLPMDVYLKNGDDESSPPSRLLLSGHLDHAQLQPFLFSELQAATNNFALENRVGTGGSADVYRGVLSNGNVVAIKKLLKISVAEREFLNEIAVVATLKHRNLATLIGYSESNLGFLLVFDFYPNGSMEDAIFSEDYPKRLTWGQCIEVVVGAARGIAHLHGLTVTTRESQQKVIHRDIKPSNILLDSEFQACVADFGVSRNLTLAQTHVTTKIMGTFGYVAPEYAGTGKLTEKSDVYSFGVLMLVAMSKRQPAGAEMNKLGTESLVEYAFSLARKEQMLLMISTDYEGQFTIDEAERFISVALLCVQPVPQMRPTIDKVVLMLEGRDDVPPVPIPAARSASSMLPGLKRLIFGEDGLTGSSMYTTTTLESLTSTQAFDRSSATSYEPHEGPQRGDRDFPV